MIPGRAAGPWLAAGVVLLGLAGFWNLAAGIRPTDEAWFLQVVARVHGGESLYRDAFFGTTPLAVWLAAAVTSIAGLEIGVAKALRVGCFVGSALIAAQLVIRTTGRPALAALLLGAGLLFAAPDPKALYSPLAELLLLATAGLGLRAYRETRADAGAARPGRWLAPGLTAGLCLGAKHNAGAFVALALAAAALLAGGPPRAVAQRILAMTGAAAAPLVVIALVLASAGAIAAFVDQGFTGKVIYLEHAPIPYGDGLRALAAALRIVEDGRSLAPVFPLQAFLLAPAVALLGVAALIRSAGAPRREFIVLALFVVASFATVFPRADHGHLVHAVLALLVLGACAWGHVRSALPARAAIATEVALGLWIAVGLVVVFVDAAGPIVRRELVRSTLPRLGGALIAREAQETVGEQARSMASELGPEAFIVSSRAGFWYLVTGVRNPTPWDWPGVTSMGTRGQDEAVARIVRGEIANVCLDTRDWGLNPRRLEEAVAAHMERVRDLGPCVLYRRE